MSDTATRADLSEFKNDLKEYFREGLERVEERLDKLNGAVARHEVRIAEEAQKVKALEHQVFPRSGRGAVLPDGGKRTGFYVIVGMGTVWIIMRLLEALGGRVVELAWTAFTKGKIA